MKRLIISLLSLLLIVSCTDKQMSTIDGQFHGVANRTISLEQLSPNGGVIVDTTMTNSDGKFSFKIDMKEAQEPTFYNVRYENQYIPLLIDKGEKIQLDAVGNLYINYNVSGSVGSESLSKFNRQTVSISMRLDSLSKLYNNTQTDELRSELGRQISKEYIKLKQQTISFVMRNSTSLVSIVPLYQPIYNGKILFDDPTDIVYYRAIADSLETRYPKSAYVKSLRSDIQRIDNVYAMDSLMSSSINSTSNYPDLDMKDAAGKSKKLSSLAGKTILLSFTSSSLPALKIINRELADIYKKYSGAGFEIFEVSIDVDKASWLKSITDNRLPWIQVCDFMGEQSPALTTYNVKSLPANFLINKDGVIVDKNLTSKQLDEELAKLLN